MAIEFDNGLLYAAGQWYVVCRNGSLDLHYRAVMEGHLRRPLRDDEVIHHLNGDSRDNRIENLQLFRRDGSVVV